MQDVEVLKEMAESSEEWVSRRARIALDLLEQYEQNAITEDEFQELCEDLVRADELDAEASDLETKAALVTAVYGVAQII